MHLLPHSKGAVGLIHDKIASYVKTRPLRYRIVPYPAAHGSVVIERRGRPGRQQQQHQLLQPKQQAQEDLNMDLDLDKLKQDLDKQDESMSF
ncbi:hypothetical protein VTP01DRAFT_9777 [Rhizomucor pusillus]|uniref:uncharacterized protein n=1 Tax=Rhizomucor pusillus TaxID=4840 RepID=UPI0037424807